MQVSSLMVSNQRVTTFATGPSKSPTLETLARGHRAIDARKREHTRPDRLIKDEARRRQAQGPSKRACRVEGKAPRMWPTRHGDQGPSGAPWRAFAGDNATTTRVESGHVRRPVADHGGRRRAGYVRERVQTTATIARAYSTAIMMSEDLITA
jgi:hypothetical protein